MKKFIFFMPLMAISLLASCNSNPETTDVYTVNKEELYGAITFKDITYLQYNSKKEVSEIYGAYTATSFHMIEKNTDVQDDYLEYFIIKNGSEAKEYKRNNAAKKFDEVDYVEEDFSTISDFAKFLEPLINKDYGDFYYSEKKKEYMTTDCVLEDKSKIYYNIQFLNKKVNYFVINYISEETPSSVKFQLTYDKVEPPTPN